MRKIAKSASVSSRGSVLSIRGSVVDIEFNSRLPPVHQLLHADNNRVVIGGRSDFHEQ